MTSFLVDAFGGFEILLLVLENLRIVSEPFTLQKLIWEVRKPREQNKTLNSCAVRDSEILLKW